MTLQEWVAKGEAQLRKGPHPDRARRDAETLLLHVVRRERAAFLARWKEVLDVEEAGLYVDFIERRFAGEPIQYIFGETEFYGLPFQVTRDVLIPRPETEHLVEHVLELAGRFTQPRIADIGAGSGAIAVTLAAKLPDAHLTAIDLSGPALAIARDNAARNTVESQIRFLHGDLLSPVAAERFEIVVSNPPYVPSTDLATLSVEVRDYEPEIALFAGNDGLEIYRRLIPDAFAVLVPGGFLALEIGYGQQPAIAALLQAAGFAEIEFLPDLQGFPRVASARRP
jgi:release factor glutamine methyltransferase